MSWGAGGVFGLLGGCRDDSRAPLGGLHVAARVDRDAMFSGGGGAPGLLGDLRGGSRAPSGGLRVARVLQGSIIRGCVEIFGLEGGSRGFSSVDISGPFRARSAKVGVALLAFSRLSPVFAT